MFKKLGKTLKIAPFENRFVAKLLVVRQFGCHNSTCHSFIYKNPNFLRSVVFHIRVINFFRRPPKKEFSRTGRHTGGKPRSSRSCLKGQVQPRCHSSRQPAKFEQAVKTNFNFAGCLQKARCYDNGGAQLGQIYQNDIQDQSGKSPADISNQVNFVSI